MGDFSSIKDVKRLLANWNQLTSWLDILGDTSNALDAFLRTYPSSSTGQQYLFVYGALQSLSMQQDAADAITKVFKLEIQCDPRIDEIRQTRIDLLHPGNIRREGVMENTMLARHSLNEPQNLKVLYAPSRRSDEEKARKGFTSINIPKMILDQDTLLSESIKSTELLLTLERLRTLAWSKLNTHNIKTRAS